MGLMAKSLVEACVEAYQAFRKNDVDPEFLKPSFRNAVNIFRQIIYEAKERLMEKRNAEAENLQRSEQKKLEEKFRTWRYSYKTQYIETVILPKLTKDGFIGHGITSEDLKLLPQDKLFAIGNSKELEPKDIRDINDSIKKIKIAKIKLEDRDRNATRSRER